MALEPLPSPASSLHAGRRIARGIRLGFGRETAVGKNAPYPESTRSCRLFPDMSWDSHRTLGTGRTRSRRAPVSIVSGSGIVYGPLVNYEFQLGVRKAFPAQVQLVRAPGASIQHQFHELLGLAQAAVDHHISPPRNCATAGSPVQKQRFSYSVIQAIEFFSDTCVQSICTVLMSFVVFIAA